MRFVLILLLVLIGQRALAETVSVQAGEHEGFTRIVLQMKGVAAWQMGRTEAGYALRIDRPDLRFDLASVFRAIPRTRLRAVWADPETGALRLGLGCACHAIAFEFRPDVLVIDLRDGPPPAGSSFEAALGGAAVPVLAARFANRPRSRPATPVSEALVLPPEPGATLADLPSPDLDAARTALLQELSRAASAGVIEMGDPAHAVGNTGPPAVLGAATGLLGHVLAGAEPGLSAHAQGSDPPALTAEGRDCVPDAALAVPDWAGGEGFATGVAEKRQALVGEFDHPRPEAVADLVRFYLHYGFGAEARAVLTAFPGAEADRALWIEMASILDGGSLSGESLIATQAACPGAAALWASLALPEIAPAGLDRAAVTLAFSALPLHLRRQLGPALAEKFLAAEDISTAQTLRQAFRRAPGEAGPAADLLDAKLDQSRGDLVAGEVAISEVAGTGGPLAVRAVIDLVDARLAQELPVDGGTIADLAALAQENKGGPLAEALHRAEMLARGSAGDFETAFAMAEAAPPAAVSDLWHLLVRAGPDSAILSQGIRAESAALPKLDDDLKRDMALRLITLGFPSDALRWLPGDDTSETSLLAARAELMLKDARAALRSLAGMTEQEAEALRAAALTQLGDLEGAAQAYGAADQHDAVADVLWRARHWQAGAVSRLEAARPLVGVLLAPQLPPPALHAATPLADGRALVAESVSIRDAVLALLSAVPSPARVQP